MARFALGVDIGGTLTKIGLVSDEGEILERSSFPTTTASDREALLIFGLQRQLVRGLSFGACEG
jgi:predicted NBD/HSP70 family sugar kinase